MGAGRPTKKTPELLDEICELIGTSSMGLRAVAKELAVDFSTIKKWLREDEEFSTQYARAKREQADFMVEETIAIADDTSNDTIHVETKSGGYDIPNKEWIDRSKLRVQARQWAAGKLAPKKYGDKLEIDAPNGLINVTIRE